MAATGRSSGCPDGSRRRAAPLTPDRLDEMRAELAAPAPGTPLDELAVQNQQLLAALDEVRAQRDELARLNAELEETNRGVMALYHQLSEELEETNRGVVALYAELDEKSAQLRAASEAKSRFLANVSHELRAPVTAVIGLGRLLADAGVRPADRRAGPPGRADPRLGRATCSRWSTTCSTWPRRSPAGSSRTGPRSTCGPSSASCAARCGRWPPAPRSSSSSTSPSRARPCVTDEVLLAQVLRNLLHQRAEVHRARRGAAERAGAGDGDCRVHGRRHRHRHPAPSCTSGSSRSSTRCPAAGAAAHGHRPRPAVRPAAGHACSAARCGWPASRARAARSPCACPLRRPS